MIRRYGNKQMDVVLGMTLDDLYIHRLADLTDQATASPPLH